MAERDDIIEECAAFVEFYGEERLHIAGDSILHDPLLSGGQWTSANIAKSQELTVDGTINSAAYHAAKDIAAHLRAMKSKSEPTP